MTTHHIPHGIDPDNRPMYLTTIHVGHSFTLEMDAPNAEAAAEAARHLYLMTGERHFQRRDDTVEVSARLLRSPIGKGE